MYHFIDILMENVDCESDRKGSFLFMSLKLRDCFKSLKIKIQKNQMVLAINIKHTLKNLLTFFSCILFNKWRNNMGYN